MPWGRLGRATVFVNTLADWSAGDFIIETTVPVKASVEPSGANPPTLEHKGVERRLEEIERKTVVALLIGLDNGKPAAVRLWQTVITPFQALGYSTRGGARRPLFGTQAFLDSAGTERLQEVADAVDARYARRLDIAVQRAVSAVTARADEHDGLIDAVIALESLFAGTDKSELSFRIAAAAAWLLEPEHAGAREALYREVRGLYKTRSKIVHGQGDVADAGAHRDRAFDVVVKSLRRLYEELPALLKDDQRSQKLILHIDDEAVK